MPGLELVPKAARHARPLSGISRDGPRSPSRWGDPPAGATDASGTSPNFVQPLPTGSATKRVLSPVFTRISTRALAFGARAGDRLAHVGRRRNCFAADFENYVAGRETVVGGDAGRIDAGDYDAVVAGAGDARGRSKREAELAEIGVPLSRCSLLSAALPWCSAVRRVSE